MNMDNNNDRKGRTKDVKDAFFPTPAAQFEMPDWYGEMLVSIKDLLQMAEDRLCLLRMSRCR